MSKRKRDDEGVEADVVRALQKNAFEKMEAILRREFEKLTSDWDTNERNEQAKTALHFAVYLPGYLDVVKTLLKNGADVNDVNDLEETSLHIALGQGHVDVAKLLIQNGADVNAKDKDERG